MNENVITIPPPPRIVFGTPPPPRPSSINERAAAPVVESCDKPPRGFFIRWSAVTTVIVALAVGFCIGSGVQFQIDHAAPIVNEPAASVPWCTEPIADAGGICHGEPLEACATEDSANCYWDARGTGRSFVDVDGVVYYQDVTR